jgi:hypothetical protein
LSETLVLAGIADGRGESALRAAPEQHSTTSRLRPREPGRANRGTGRQEFRVNYSPRNLPKSALPDVVDILLADIAIRIQLTKTDHDKAVDRFAVMRDWIDRPGSPLRGLVALMYPQGSMAIGATIARCSEREEYDIDVIVALLIARASDPQIVLDALYHAIRGEPGSRYYDKTTRHTRCVCVTYEDGMHIDLAPAVLVDEREPRTSVIFHSKPKDPSVPKLRLLANPWGLAEWFKVMTPLETDFAKMFEGRAMAHDRALGEPVPDQESAYRKSRALIALQLTKRWRNVLFSKPERAKLRRPPSVLLSKHFADHANRTTTLSEEVEHQAQQLLLRLEAEKAVGRLIHEANPRCFEDVLTDRWPEVPANQNLMIEDLHDFVADMRLLRSGTLSIDKMSAVLERMFGERPARSAVNDYMFPSSRPHVEYGTGRIVRPVAAAAVTAPALRPVAGHTFFGDHW